MSTKVTNVETKKIYSDTNSSHILAESVVAKGKIKLMYLSSFKTVISEEDTYYHPIIISETDAVEIGDKYLTADKRIVKWLEEFHKEWGNDFDSCPKKIIALPEHFTPKQLQDIIDGKMKDGDTVYIKCIDMAEDGQAPDWEIAKDLENHIDILKVEEPLSVNVYRHLYKKALHKLTGLTDEQLEAFVEGGLYTKEQMEKSFDAGVAFRSQFREDEDFDEELKVNPEMKEFSDWIKTISI